MVPMSEPRTGRRRIMVFGEITMQRFLKEPGLDIARIFPAITTHLVLSLAKPRSAFRRDDVFSLGHRSRFAWE